MRFARATTSMAVLVGVALVTSSEPTFADPIIWNGPSITFTKPDFADWTLPANQDRLTNDVWLTRMTTRPLFNIAAEEFADPRTSPFDTEWAFGPTQSGNPGPVTASNFANLEFAPFARALGNAIGDNALAYGPGVLHLISNDIYLDIKFTSWAGGDDSPGGFSYIRSTPVEAPIPEPSSAALVIVGGVAWVGIVTARRTRKGTRQFRTLTAEMLCPLTSEISGASPISNGAPHTSSSSPF